LVEVQQETGGPGAVERGSEWAMTDEAQQVERSSERRSVAGAQRR
jgi:hypothetical protein